MRAGVACLGNSTKLSWFKKRTILWHKDLRSKQQNELVSAVCYAQIVLPVS